jgi:hypothetical protein
MKTVQATVNYKVKVRQIGYAGQDTVPMIDYKKSISRRDCNLKPHQHAYYNSDLFPAMLNRAVAKATNGKGWSRLSELPEAVSVDTSGFLATVTIRIEV